MFKISPMATANRCAWATSIRNAVDLLVAVFVHGVAQFVVKIGCALVFHLDSQLFSDDCKDQLATASLFSILS